jgi:hypothetical protein
MLMLCCEMKSSSLNGHENMMGQQQVIKVMKVE